jgi:glycosyltransferase involved in cell wall biosynthesis
VSRGVCILTETYWPVVGGGETQARVLAAGMVERGLRVTVVTRRSDPALPETEQRDGVEILRLPPSGRGHLNKWGLLPTAFPALVRARERFDAVVVSGFRVLGVPALLAGGLVGRPCVLKADSLGEMSGEFFEAGLRRLHLRPDSAAVRGPLALRNRLLRRADAWVAISSAIREELIRAGIPAEAIESIPNGVDTAHFRPVADDVQRSELRRRLGLDPGRALVVYTGRLVSYKGLPVLLRAWERMKGRETATLLLVGSGGLDIHDCEEELRDAVRDRGLGDGVVFAGAVDDVAPYLQAADVYVLPSENEAFGISLVEAMACGLPAVATTVGGLADILRDGATGIAAPAGDPGPLGEALDRLLERPAERDSMGARAREVARAEFSATAVVNRYVELVDRLVDGTVTPGSGRP